MARARPDPSTGEGWRTIHVRPATYERLAKLRGRGGSFDAVIADALTWRAVYFHPQTPGSYRPRNSTFYERLAGTAEFGLRTADLCDGASWIRRSKHAGQCCSACGEEKYQRLTEVPL